MVQVHAVMLDGGEQRILPFGSNLPSGSSGVVVIGRHLRQQPVAQAQRRIAKSGKLTALQQFRKHRRASNYDLSAAQPDSVHVAALCQREPSQHLGNASHLLARNRHPTLASRAVEGVADGG